MVRTSSLTVLVLSACGLATTVVADEAPKKDDRPLVFESNIQPLLSRRCGKCHNDKTRKGGLELSTIAGLRRGGESGESVLADQLDDSLLWQMIDSGDMPPEGEPRLTDSEKQQIRRWIASGSRSDGTHTATVTQHDVLPFLYTRCVVCHGRRQQSGDLDLRTVESIIKGGKSGPAIRPGDPAGSLLLKRVHAKDMPPPRELIRAGVRPLEAPEIALITKWIAQGARKYDVAPDVQTNEPDRLVSNEQRKFWAFQTPHKPELPKLARTYANPVDQFLAHRLADQQLEFSASASRRSLVRRVAFDLTGLPPQWQDVQRFMDDSSPDWYTHLVDHYLDSPQYGHRWGRHWLDLCGYADSEGKRSADPVRPHAWRYRDYVIRSFNADKPYNRFLLEQIAGDELYDYENAKSVTTDMMDALVATGFLRMAPDGTGSDIVDTVEERFEVVADELEILGSAVLGLTLRCAQCHSHKYDPIPQRDYYRLVAVFQPAYDVYDWLKPTSVPGQSKQSSPNRRYLKYVTEDIRREWSVARDKHQARIAELQKPLQTRLKELRQQHVDRELAKLPKALHADLRAMLTTADGKRNKIQKYLAEKFGKQLTVSDTQLVKQNQDVAQLKKSTDKRVKELQAQAPPEPMIRALWDRGTPSPTWIFRRGDFKNPGDLVGPGVLSALTDGQTPFVPQSLRPGSTGRRLAFARWLTQPDHPLTARVMVNRVWFHHFGRGIVESLSNFGKTGTRPTHPELLDWLSVGFVENGWSLKWLHRQIMNTEAYRQSSHTSPRLLERDPDNRWLSRMPLRRLEAEAVRDSLLAVAGQLDVTTWGPPVSVTVKPDGLVVADKTSGGWKRTIYVQQRRKELPTILETFDLPQMMPNCVERPNSTVAPQALLMLNNSLVREWALAFARRVEAESPNNPSQQIDRVYQIALSRAPDPQEKQYSLAALEKLTAEWKAKAAGDKTEDVSATTRALANYCHVVMNSAAFLYVD